MAHDPTDLRAQTKAHALQTKRLFRELPNCGDAQVIGRQILRSGASVGAQYREACRAKSPADFISKMKGSLQELDETGYWLELLTESGLVPAARIAALQAENFQLTAIFVASIRTAKNNRGRR